MMMDHGRFDQHYSAAETDLDLLDLGLATGS